MIVDILIIITVIAGAILVFIAAWQYEWKFSLLPAGLFTGFWIIWFFLDTKVPFEMMDKVWFFILVIASIIVAETIGLLLRWNNLQDCDPRVENCTF